jgi:hypothetical protein
MNPPPYQPPQEAKNPIVRQVLLASLIALPVVALIIFVVAHAVVAHRKTMQSRAAWKNVASSANQMRSDMKKDFNPKMGITNIDFAKLEKLRQTLQNASANSTGDEAVFAKSLTGFMDRMQFAARNYHESATKMREARVLYNFDSSNKEQFAPRRELVHQFLEANTALEKVITNAEDQIRADLAEAHVQPTKIDALLAGYHASSGFQTSATMKIRQCDDQYGAALLDVFDTLETNWGHWDADPTADKIRFKDHATLEAYNKHIAEIKAVGQEQLRLQNLLVNQPSAQPSN